MRGQDAAHWRRRVLDIKSLLLGQKEDTPKFVNGILGKILIDIDKIKDNSVPDT